MEAARNRPLSHKSERRENLQRHVRGCADDKHVADRANPWPLAQWDPDHQHHGADDVDDQAQADPGQLRQALVEHRPRVQAQLRAHHQGERQTVEQQAELELDEAAREHGRGCSRAATGFDWRF